MADNDEAVRAELRSQIPEGFAIEMAEAFPLTSGWGVKKRNQQRVDWIRRAAPLLERILEPGERIRHLTLGNVSYPLELVMMGAWAQMINRTLIVFTSSRVLMIHSDGRGQPRSFVNEIPLQAIKKMKGGFLGSLQIAAGKGTRNFAGIPKDSRKVIDGFVHPNPGATGSFRHLCSSCFAAHDQHLDRCSRCNSTFKSPKTAALRSLILPGLGDWYIGHRGFAALEMIGSIFVWIIVIALIAEEGVVGFVLGLILLGLVNGMDAILTYFQAKKGLMSSDGALPSLSAGASHASLGEAPPPPIA